MAAFLTYEDIKRWRSSTEKLTLEEYAAKIGKLLENKKETHDLYDIVSSEEPIKTQEPVLPKGKEQPKIIQEIKAEPELKAEPVQQLKKEETVSEIKIQTTKKLNPREEVILEYLKENMGKVVFARDMAKILNLPTDYVYKYIKNLREKVGHDVLVNAEAGGYVLKI